MYQKIRKSVSANSVNQQNSNQFAPPSFKVQAKPYYPTKEKQGNQSEDLTVQGKEQSVKNTPEVKSGRSFADIPALRPEIQERSSNEELSWVQRVFKAERTPNYPVNPYQAKLTIGQPGDKYEQEADRVANRIVRQINTPPKQSNHQQSLQRQEIKERREKLGIQGRLAVGGREASQDLSSAINSARGRGQSLDAGLQQSMGQAMGADFSRVKIHTDAKSDQLNESIQAKAFTTGHDVFFRRGAYEPGSRGGQELIAHELTHVVQQNGNNIQAKPDTSTIQRVSVKERIKFFESLGVKNESKGGIPLEAKDISPVIAPTKEEGSNPSGPYGLTEEKDSNSSGPYGLTEEKDSNPSGPYGLTEEKDSNPSGPYGLTEEKDSNSSGAYGLTEEKDSNPSGPHVDDNDIISSERGENDNYEAPKKYQNVKERGYKYENEDKDSSQFILEIVANARQYVNHGIFASMAEALNKLFGWSDEDTAKFYNEEDTKVEYLDEESRKDYELTGGSTLKQGEPPITFDTSKMFSKFSGNGFGIYVMSPNGELYSHAHKVGFFHHSSFLAGLPTAGAGEIKVIGGTLQHITNKSGHYLPGEKNMVQTLQEFKSRGVNLAGVKLTFLSFLNGEEKTEEFDSAQEFLDKNEHLVEKDKTTIVN